jgi:hypothetical protein
VARYEYEVSLIGKHSILVGLSANPKNRHRFRNQRYEDAASLTSSLYRVLRAELVLPLPLCVCG